MSESGSSGQTTSDGAQEEIDDPGRDPKGLNPPRNLFGGGPDQDSGQGKPADTPGTEGESMMPEAPTEDDDRA
jgi:hypothetical protein